MANFITMYKDEGPDAALPSQVIWADCPLLEMMADGRGVYFIEDFVPGGKATGSSGYFGAFGDTGSTVTYANEVNGAVVLTEASDDEIISIFGAPAFQITQNGGKFWFEARLKTSNITASKQAFFVGLMDATTVTSDIPLTNTGTISDTNVIGFHKEEGNTTAFDATYKANGETQVVVNENVGTLAVDTYVKLGMRFDPEDTSGDATLRFYIDGVEQASSKVIPNATGTDFPADVAMKWFIGQSLAASETETLTIDWVRVAQLR
tara:strand:- start:2671 stop:3462 length:792 start_codon:yes stop_codon:yes gene_type:complete